MKTGTTAGFQVIGEGGGEKSPKKNGVSQKLLKGGKWRGLKGGKSWKG